MRETNKEKVHSCECTLSTSGYGSAVHYFICSACAGEGYPEGRFLDYHENQLQEPARLLYRSSVVRTRRPTFGLTPPKRLARYRQELISAMPHLLARRLAEKREPKTRTSDKSVKLAILRVVTEIRRVSREIGPVRPLVKTKSEDHE